MSDNMTPPVQMSDNKSSWEKVFLKTRPLVKIRLVSFCLSNICNNSILTTTEPSGMTEKWKYFLKRNCEVYLLDV